MSDDSERLHDDSRGSSIPTQHERIKQLEAEVARLRRQRKERKQRIEELEAGIRDYADWLLTSAKDAERDGAVVAAGVFAGHVDILLEMFPDVLKGTEDEST